MAGTLEDLVNRIKDLPVSEVMSRYIHTVRKGTQTLAVCPFHDDHSPSLNINDTRGMWYCFVDRMGGDSIRFVMLYKNLEFKNALEDICDKLGWDYASYAASKKSSPKYDMGKRVLQGSCRLYRKVVEGSQCQPFNNFLKNRGLTEELASTYQLGYAPSQSALFDYFSSISSEADRGEAIKIASELGLIRPSKFGEKTHYDTFRSRIIFPIWDQFGQVIGYTSRAINDDQKPKYMNSIDSFMFNKSNLLYGLHLAKPFIREKDQVLIVEGNMDQIALYNYGFKNTVAIMGVALGESSLSRLLSLTKNIYLALDNDQAGWKASSRINAQFMEQGLIPKFLDLKETKDPDDFLKEHGHVAMQKQIDEAPYFVDRYIESLIPQEIPEVAERKLEILTQTFDALAPLKNSLSATERIIAMAKRLGLQSDSSTLLKNYENYLTTSSSPAPFREAKKEEENISILNNEEVIPHKAEVKRKISSLEAKLLQNLVQNPMLLTYSEVSELLDFVENPDVKGYILAIKDLIYDVEDSEYQSVLTKLMDGENFSAELSSIVSAALYKRHSFDLDLKDKKIALKTIEDIKNKLEEEQLNIKKLELKEKQKAALSSEEHNKILMELHALEKEKQLFRTNAKRKNKNLN